MHFEGDHCETTAAGTLLSQLDIHLSEPMLFGLGEGLGFIFWNMKTMNFPFIGGRIKPDALTENIAKNLSLELRVKETSSQQKAWDSVKQLVDHGQFVGLKLDCFHLDYFSTPIHFAAHYVALLNYDEHFAYLQDTKQQGGTVKTSLKSLALARAEKGPMASKNLYYTLQVTGQQFDLREAIITSIKSNANDYLNPPISNIGYKGILKASSEIIHWYQRSKDIKNDFKTTAMLMEKAGTGGALFRNLYRDFLKESVDLLKLDKLEQAYLAFAEIALLWTSISDLFEALSQTEDFTYIQQASDMLKSISDKEKCIMQMLSTL